jgi:putative PIN family toxin of toxin-antitoxin system
LTPPRVVFDAVVFVQALISGRGPAAACVETVRAGQAALFLSDAIVAEMKDVPRRPELTSRYRHLTSERVDEFVRDVQTMSIHVATPAHALSLPRDPKDEPYTDLAIEIAAEFLVTWNERHLTYLMRGDTPEGKSFCEKFPQLTILSPPVFLQKLAARQKP